MHMSGKNNQYKLELNVVKGGIDQNFTEIKF